MTGRATRGAHAGLPRAAGSGPPHPAVHALMAGAIDYAGLFPPAGLAMDDAVSRYDRYRHGPHAWMLGRFIVPVARLEEFVAAFAALHAGRGEGREEGHASGHASGHAPGSAPNRASPWPISVIARASDAAALAAFNAQYGSRVRIDAVEAPPVHEADTPALASLSALAATHTVFAEVGWAGDPAPLIGALARYGIAAKLRTGGVTADAFPDAEAIARFMVSCRDAHVRFKATAGLHHAWRAAYPLTYEPGCARATMHGFLNVLLASTAATGGAGVAELATILAATGGAGFVVEERGIVLPSGRAVPAELVIAARGAALASFGSCSFEEPVAELTERGFL